MDIVENEADDLFESVTVKEEPEESIIDVACDGNEDDDDDEDETSDFPCSQVKVEPTDNDLEAKVRRKRRRKRMGGRGLSTIEKRRKKAKKRRIEMRMLETLEEQAQRRDSERLAQSLRRAAEDPSERQARLDSMRTAAAARRARETDEQRAMRLEKSRVAAAMRRARETPEERAKRLETLRLAQAARRARERKITDFAKTAMSKWEQLADLLNYSSWNDELRNFIFWEVMRLQEEAAKHCMLNQEVAAEGEPDGGQYYDEPVGLRLFQHFMTTRDEPREEPSDQTEKPKKITLGKAREPTKKSVKMYEKTLKVAFDTAERRKRRLETMRLNQAMRRSQESLDKRRARLEKHRLHQARRRASETPEVRAERLRKMRLAQALKRARRKLESGEEDPFAAAITPQLEEKPTNVDKDTRLVEAVGPPGEALPQSNQPCVLMG